MIARVVCVAVVLFSLCWSALGGTQTEVGGWCWAGHKCASGMTCEAWYHVCRRPGKEGEACHVTRPCGSGFQCEAGTHVCMAPGKEGERCHLTRHCSEGHSCQPVFHKCVRMGNVGEKCVSGWASAEGRRCNYQKNYWCDPFTRTCLPPSGKGNICGYIGEKEDSGECVKGLECKCDTACSIRDMLRDLQSGLSGVAGTIQDWVGAKKYCCKCVEPDG